MQDVAGRDRTVLFVSHNMGAISAICETGILLEQGHIKGRGRIKQALDAYRSSQSMESTRAASLLFSGPLRAINFNGMLLNNRLLNNFLTVGSDEDIAIQLQGVATVSILGFSFTFSLYREGIRIVTFHDDPDVLPEGRFSVNVSIPAQLLRPGEYAIAAGGRKVAGDEWIWGTDLATFEVMPNWNQHYHQDDVGLFNLPGRLTRQVG